MAGEAQDEVPFHVRPLGGEDAEHHGIARGAVTSRLVMPQHTVLARAQRRDRPLRPRIEAIGAKAEGGLGS